MNEPPSAKPDDGKNERKKLTRHEKFSLLVVGLPLLLLVSMIALSKLLHALGILDCGG